MRRMWRFTLGDEGGTIFIGSLVLVTVMAILGVALFDLSMIEGGLATGDNVSNQLLYCAETALGRTMKDTAGRMTQISGLLLNTLVPTTLNPTPETVTTATFTGTPKFTCTTTVTFTSIAPLPATTGYLQAVATAPCVTAGTCVASYANNTQRSVRVQLMPWFTNSNVTDTSDPCHNSAGGIACTATTPYFNHPSWDNGGVGVCIGIGCPNMNLGYYLTNTGAYPSVLTSVAINGTAGLPGPGVALPYWTNGGGTFDPNFFFKSNGGSVAVTFQWGDSAYVPGSSGSNSDTFGWFATNSTGTSLTLHSLFTANQSGFKPGNTYTFTPCSAPCATPKYYGFYLQNPTGIYPTLSSLGTDITDSEAPGNMIKPQSIDCGGGSCSPVPFQHAALFQQSPTTYWMGMEDWDNHASGTNCVAAGGTAGCSDHDYQDLIVKIVTPSSDTVVSRAGGGSFSGGGKNWKDWQECRGSGSPPSC